MLCAVRRRVLSCAEQRNGALHSRIVLRTFFELVFQVTQAMALQVSPTGRDGMPAYKREHSLVLAPNACKQQPTCERGTAGMALCADAPDRERLCRHISPHRAPLWRKPPGARLTKAPAQTARCAPSTPQTRDSAPGRRPSSSSGAPSSQTPWWTGAAAAASAARAAENPDR